MLKIEKLSKLVPERILSKIPDIKRIHDDLILCHFLSQCAHESMNFAVVTENLNYGEKALLKIFPKYFNEKNVVNYARRPERIANRIYADRMGNGPESMGDGYKYRGRGYIQITGKDNYTAFSEYIGKNCVAYPEYVSIRYPLESAAWFFTVNNLWRICEQGATLETIENLTKRINGGLNGIEDRKNLFYKYYEALTGRKIG